MPPRKCGHKVTELNNFAISSQGIGEALMRSAAALAQANNDLDKSIALVTAANNVVQDPQVVGTALRTVSMRIRGAKAELEDKPIVPPYGNIWVNSWLKSVKPRRRAIPRVRLLNRLLIPDLSF